MSHNIIFTSKEIERLLSLWGWIRYYRILWRLNTSFIITRLLSLAWWSLLDSFDSMAILQKDLYKNIQAFDLHSILTPLKIRFHFINLILHFLNILLKLVYHMLANGSMLGLASLIIRTLCTPSILSTLRSIPFSTPMHCCIVNTKEIMV